ncbi:hypothetical protein D3C72_1653580 [compost metagenome]
MRRCRTSRRLPMFPLWIPQIPAPSRRTKLRNRPKPLPRLLLPRTPSRFPLASSPHRLPKPPPRAIRRRCSRSQRATPTAAALPPTVRKRQSGTSWLPIAVLRPRNIVLPIFTRRRTASNVTLPKPSAITRWQPNRAMPARCTISRSCRPPTRPVSRISPPPHNGSSRPLTSVCATASSTSPFSTPAAAA